MNFPDTKKLFPLLALALVLALSGCTSDSGDDEDSGNSTALLTNACSVLNLGTRVINGTPCADSQSPVVRVNIIADQGQFECSGSMLTPTHVLTAAHCFLEKTNSLPFVFANAVPVPGSVRVHPGAAIVTDDGQVKVLNDVAVIRLDRAVTLPTLPILVSDPIESGEVFSIFGYGLDENGQLGVLRSGQSRVDDVDAQHISAEFEGEGSNSCNGDSGGPAVMTVSREGAQIAGIIGLVSSGTVVSCGIGDRSLYANVTSAEMLNFIQAEAPGMNLL